jgi:hypothetical protein
LDTSLGKVNENLSQKQNLRKRAGSMAQVIELLPSKLEALGSIPCTTTATKTYSDTIVPKEYGSYL